MREDLASVTETLMAEKRVGFAGFSPAVTKTVGRGQ